MIGLTPLSDIKLPTKENEGYDYQKIIGEENHGSFSLHCKQNILIRSKNSFYNFFIIQ